MIEMENSLRAFKTTEAPDSAEMHLESLNSAKDISEEVKFPEEQYFSKHGPYDQLTLNDYLPG